MKLDTKTMKWTREPKHYSITPNKVEIITEPHTDLWQRTYYHFRNDNAPVLQVSTDKNTSLLLSKQSLKAATVLTNAGLFCIWIVRTG